ncbi:MAG: beta-propeller domain-containing protein [Candidatus Thalassarchaeaceae archaeon]
MKTVNTPTLLMIFLMATAGCLQAVDDVVEDIERTIDALEGDYPKLDLPERNRSSPMLQNYDACETLLEDLKRAVYDEMVVNLDQQSYWHWVSEPWAVRFGNPESATLDGEPMVAESTDDVAATGTDSDSGSREGEFSGTNNQESGVDEADFLKTDGFHIYMLNGQLLLIMGVPEFGNLTLESNLTIEGNPTQMMIEGDRLVISSSIYYWNLPEDSDLRNLMSEEVTVEGDSVGDDKDDDTGDWESTYTYTKVQNLVKYTVVDITNRSSPVIEKEMYIEGNYHTARMVDGTVRSVTHLWTYFDEIRTWVNLPDDYWSEDDLDKRMDIWNESVDQTVSHNEGVISELTLDDFVPHIYEMRDGEIFTHPLTYEKCTEFSASADSAGRGFTTIMTIRMLDDEASLEVDHITSSWAHVYSSKDTLVLAEPANDMWWFWRNSDWEDATNIHSFDISDSNHTTYVASGRVEGTVNDQFSISEHNGDIRVASTSDNWGMWWRLAEFDDNGDPVWSGPTNQISILTDDGEGYLDQIGYIGGIAEGETIWSARFVGDRGYLVTFMNIDPLWVLDLSDPYEPVILGELHVPGVSTYIHPIDEDNLLTIGIAGGQDGLGLDWSTTQVSLFDVSNTSSPTLADTIPLTPAYTDENCMDIMTCGWSWSYSEATYEHKAFNYWSPESLLAVPLSTHRYVYDQIEVEGRVYSYSGYQYVSMLKMIEVDTENGTLSNHGDVEHSGFYNEEGLSSWWSGSTSIRRSIFMGDYVYSFSGGGATVHRTADLQLVVELELPGNEPVDHYYALEEVEVGTSGSSSEEVETNPCNEPDSENCED